MFARDAVNEALHEFEDNFQSALGSLFSGVEFTRELRAGRRRIAQRVKLIFNCLSGCVPDEVILDYVYHRIIIVDGTAKEPERIRVCIRGSNKEINTFSFEDVFITKGSEHEISAWMASIFRLLIENEYALSNLKEVNLKMEEYCRRAYRTYTVSFTTAISNRDKINYISDKKVVISVPVENAIAIANVYLFQEGYTITSKGQSMIARTLVDPIKKCETTVSFVLSGYPLVVFLWGTDKIHLIKELKSFAEIPYDRVPQGGTGIGYVERETLFGIKQKTQGVNAWLLSPFYKQGFQPVSFD